MALQLSNLVGDVFLNGVIPSPDAVLISAGQQPAELTVFAGASLDLVREGVPQDKVAEVSFPPGDTLNLTIQHPPSCYLTRRCHAPATYDLQTDWGRVILREGGHTP